MQTMSQSTDESAAIESNKAVARRYWEELFSEGKLEVADEIVLDSWTIDNPGVPHGLRGPEALKQLVMMFRTGVPDLKFQIDDMRAEGDRVVVRYTASGTHLGPLFGIPATGRVATMTGLAIDRLENGKLAERWGNFDTLGLLQQLGAIPPMG